MLLAFHLGLRPIISDAAATAIQKIGLARIASMTGKSGFAQLSAAIPA
jgi:hypothetical protein